ncbi:hypothetical protein [Burkholderia sp. LMG 13014]|uniref:hypothetical protein n=1 Tax=Burkholderia sp. LMG 13014 TaxID=2709306 RepID=UPI0019644416|nr:hypothetical protein [Burkholderia sp. LMG 13014]
MSYTIVAHFGVGRPTLFPDSPEAEELLSEGAVGQVYLAADGDSGGFIVATIGSGDHQMLLEVYERHLKDNDLKAIAVHRHGDRTFLTSKTQEFLY